MFLFYDLSSLLLFIICFRAGSTYSPHLLAFNCARALVQIFLAHKRKCNQASTYGFLFLASAYCGLNAEFVRGALAYLGFSFDLLWQWLNDRLATILIHCSVIKNYRTFL